MKYVKEFFNTFSKRDLFSTRDVTLFLKSKGASGGYANLFLNNLVSKERLFRIKNGFYSFSKKIDFVEKTFFPSYHGLGDALSFHGIWGQQTIPVIITPRKFRSGLRVVSGGKVLVKRISRKMFFGYESVPHLDSFTTVSDLEKTLIDFVYFNEPLSEETLKTIKKRINKKRLFLYLKQTSKKTRAKIEKLI